MTPSAHGAAESWAAEASSHPSRESVDFTTAEPEFDLLAQEDSASDPLWSAAESAEVWGTLDAPANQQYAADEDEFTRSTWQRVSAFETAEGLSGRGVIVLSALAAAGCAALDLLLTGGRITFFFDLCFVVVCLVGTLAVRRSDLFTAGVLPPLLFAGVIAALSLVVPDAFESAPGVSKVFLTGLANHAPGLVFGYGATLVAVAGRMASSKTA